MSLSFKEKVFKIVKSIPKGKTMSYKQVAVKVGNEKAARAIGRILSQNFDPNIPCHRVICSDFSPGGYNRGQSTKIKLLLKEGVKNIKFK